MTRRWGPRRATTAGVRGGEGGGAERRALRERRARFSQARGRGGGKQNMKGGGRGKRRPILCRKIPRAIAQKREPQDCESKKHEHKGSFERPGRIGPSRGGRGRRRQNMECFGCRLSDQISLPSCCLRPKRARRALFKRGSKRNQRQGVGGGGSDTKTGIRRVRGNGGAGTPPPLGAACMFFFLPSATEGARAR